MYANGQERRSLMERSGMGLLPGMGLACVLAVGATAAILLGTWWAVAAALVCIAGVLAGLVVVIWAVTSDDDADAERKQRWIPGL